MDPISTLNEFRCLNLSLLPTPVQLLDGLGAQQGCQVYCKRDDLTGFGFGGNKSRKLDYLVADALDKGCNTLVAVGALQSNYCRMTAAFGKAVGLDVHLVLGGKAPLVATGNLLLSKLLGAHFHYVDSSDWNQWEQHAADITSALQSQGQNVYRMPVGGSTPLGSLGYVRAMSEIIADEQRLGTTFSHIVLASSSAGTQAGLVAGQAMNGWPGEIIGFSTARQQSEQVESVSGLATATLGLLKMKFNKPRVTVDDSQLGDGYGYLTQRATNAISLFASRYGMFLDHVYTGKAAAGLLEYLNTNRFTPGSRVLFLNTGGSAELFA